MKQFAAIILLVFFSCNGSSYGHLKKVRLEQSKTEIVKAKPEMHLHIGNIY